MKKSRRKIEELLWVTGLHGFARAIHQKTLDRKFAETFRKMQAFHAQLMSRGWLVFDVGANRGKFSELYSSLGARVVAIEPNPDLVRHIQLSAKSDSIEVIQAVVGRDCGLATLKVSDDKDTMSSMSVEWIAAICSQHKEYEALWARELTVPTITLNSLVQKYGEPNFIKIDVEGSEEAVLDGLTNQPPLLSFEFNTAFLEATMRCLGKRVFDQRSLFNFVVGYPFKFELDNWIGRDELKRQLGMRGTKDSHGDIFVKRSTS